MDQKNLLAVIFISFIALFLLFIISFYIIIFKCCLRRILNGNGEHRENDIKSTTGLN